MKKTARTKKLRLSTETVRVLSNAHLRTAAGGYEDVEEPTPTIVDQPSAALNCGSVWTYCWPCDTN